MTKKLTDKDRKVLKYEKRIGFVFCGLIICFGCLFNLLYFILNKTGQDYLMVSLIDIGILLLAYFVCNRINLKINRDLKINHYCPISSFNTFNIIQLQTTSPTFFYNTQIYGYQSIV
jgi:hypothetical protein